MILFRKVMRLTDPTDQSSAKKVYCKKRIFILWDVDVCA